MAQLAPGFGEKNGYLKPLEPLQDNTDPKKPKLAPGFGQVYDTALPKPKERPAESLRLAAGAPAEADLENYMANGQGGLELFGKFIGQTIPNTILGTIETASYLADWEQIKNQIQGTEQEYSNWMADAMKQAKEAIAQDSPLKVFQTADAREGFAPGDATWWAAHTPDVFSSALSLLIPAAGIAGLAGKGAQALNFGSKGMALSKGLSATLASRHAESTMEAAGLYERSYNDLLAQGVPEENARIMAGREASNVYNTNWLFAVQDFMQYSAILKGFSSAAKGSLGKSIGSLVTQTVSESAEEAGQFIVQEEAYRSATGDTSFFGPGFEDRLYEYSQDPEFKSATTLGAVGGGVFTAAGPLARGISKTSEKAQEISAPLLDRMKKLVNVGLRKEKANYEGDTATAQIITDTELFGPALFRNLKEGTIDKFRTDLELIEKQEEVEPETRRLIKDYIKDTDFIIKETAQLKSAGTAEELMEPILKTKLKSHQVARVDSMLSKEIQKIEQELIENQEIPVELMELKKLQTQFLGIKEYAKTHPEAAPIVEKVQLAYANAVKASGVENVEEQLVTTRDAELVKKSAQLSEIKNEAALIKKDLADLTTPEGRARVAKREADRLVNLESEKVLNNPKATKEEVLQAAANTTNEKLRAGLVNKHKELVNQEKGTKERETVDFEDYVNFASDIPIPTGEEIQPPTGDEILPPDVAPIITDYAGGLTPDQMKWAGFSPEQIQGAKKQLDNEQSTSKVPAQSQQKVQDQEAKKERADKHTVVSIANNFRGNGERITYWRPDKKTTDGFREATPEEIFATDPDTGLLLVNSPIIKVGQKVTLKIERDFPWMQRKGFVPNDLNNYTVNIYIEGIKKPITSLRNVDNKGIKQGSPEALLNRALREQIAENGGTLESTITGKNIGAFRTHEGTNSIEVLEYDYVPVGDTYEFQKLPHEPILGFVDFNGGIHAPAVGSMDGITDEVVDSVHSAIDELAHNPEELKKLKGKTITFRRTGTGELRMTGLEPRKLNQAESDWVTNNIADAIIEDNLDSISEVIYVEKHPSGIYSKKDKEGKSKKPDVLGLSRRRLHVVSATKTLFDVLIPTSNNKEQGWAILRGKELKNALAGKPFAFKIMDSKGETTPTLVNHPRSQELVASIKELIADQFKNVNVDNLNSKIYYMDPLTRDMETPRLYKNYYEYVKETNSIETKLPGSKTLGKGEDSSYSFEQFSLQIDPKPSKVTIDSSLEEGIMIVHDIEPEPLPVPKETEIEEDEDIIEKLYGPNAKLKAVEGSYKFNLITEKELQWFKDTIGEEFLVVAKNVDSFIAENGIDAFGQYYNSLVTIADFAPEGTAYHEAFHFLFEHLLDKKQRQAILKEVGIKKPVADLTKVEYPNIKLDDERERIPTKEVFKSVQLKGTFKIPEILSQSYEESVNVDDIVATQEDFASNYIGGLMYQPSADKINGKYYLQDGTHRIAQQILEGKKYVTLSVRYTDPESIELLQEEQLAEEFELFKLTKGKSKPKVTGIRKFFRELLTLIQQLLGLKSSIDKLFEQLDNVALTHEQKEAIKARAPSQVPTDPKLRKLPGFTYIKQQTAAIQAFSSEILRLAHIAATADEQHVTDWLSNPENTERVFQVVKEKIFQKDFDRINSKEKIAGIDRARYIGYLAMGLGSPRPGFEQYVGEYEDPTSSTGLPIDGFKTKVLKDLSRYGFTVRTKSGLTYSINNDESVESLEVLELQLQDEGERLYQVDHLLVKPSDSMSTRLKLFLSTIPEPVLGEDSMPTGETKTSLFGTAVPIDFARVDGALALKLRDSVNPITKLTELAETDPIAKVVLDALMDAKNKGDVGLFTEFGARFNRDGYYKKTTLYETKVVQGPPTPDSPTGRYVEFIVKTIDTDQASADRVIINRWREEGVRKKTINTSGEPNVKKFEGLLDRLEAYKNEYYAVKRKDRKANVPFNEMKDEFESILKELGVKIDPKVWTKFTKAEKNSAKVNKLAPLFFHTKERSLAQLLEDGIKGDDIYVGNNLLTTLARLNTEYTEDTRGGSYRNEVGNQENPINLPSYLTEFFNGIRTNPKDVVKYYKQDTFYADNAFLDAIAGASSNIELYFSSILRRNDEAPKEFERRGNIESLLMRLAVYHNNDENSKVGYFFTGTPADKVKQPMVSLPKHKDGEAFLRTVLRNTMYSEIARIQQLKDNGGVGILGDIKNYSASVQFKYIPELNTVPNLVESLTGGEVTPQEKMEALTKADEVINQFIKDNLQEYKEFLRDNNLVTLSEKGELVPTKRFPKGLTSQGKVNSYLENFFYNDFAWRMEMSKVLMGDLALYPDNDQYIKRMYQLVTPGLKPFSETPKTLTIAIYPAQFKTTLEDVIEALKGLVEDKSIIENYRKINKTDAQSLITIDGYRTIAQAVGPQAWTRDHERLYTIAWSRGLTAREAIEQLVEERQITAEEGRSMRNAAAKMFLQPLKPFQYNNREVRLPNGKIVIIKEQFKDSITPIIPELTKVHQGYRDLLQYMKDNSVDIMSAEDAVKVGLYGVADLSAPIQDWQKRTVNLTDIRIPQLLPETKKDEILASQVHKLILGNIHDDTIYKFNGKLIKGSTVKEKWNTLWEEKIEKSAAALRTKLGVGSTLELSDKPNIRKAQLYKLKTVLEQELSSRDLNENYQDVIELINIAENQIDFTVPISFPAFAKLQSIITNLWKKNVIKQKSPGYSAVNLADFGIGYDDELKFITNSNGEVVEAEIGLPLEQIGKLGLKYGTHIGPYGKILWDKLDKEQQKALQFILFRIPTSNKSSMLPVRVVKILPPNLNNVVIIPGELTVQQGLDFDVDKSQLLRRVTDSEGKAIKDSVDNQLFDLYWSVLTNKAHTDELLTKLDSPTIRERVERYKEFGLVDSADSSSIFTVQADTKAEIRNKDGKAQIGIASVYNTGHSMLQLIKDYIGVNRGIAISISGQDYHASLGQDRDVYGKLISENHAESQQAALDSAKEPLLAYAGIVTGTTSAFHTMIDFGIPLTVATDFFMQPVVREWTKIYKQEGENIQKAFDRIRLEHKAIDAGLDSEVNYRLTDKNLEKGITNSIGDSTAHDIAVLQELQNILNIATQLGKVNKILSIDTFDDYTGIEALESFEQVQREATDSGALVYIDGSLFSNEAPAVSKRLASFYKNGIQGPLNYISQFYPSATQPYRLVRSAYAEAIGELQINDKATIKAVNQFTDFYNLDGDSLLDRTLRQIYPEEGRYRKNWSLFDINYSLWDRINEIVEVNPALENNEFLRNLETRRTKENRAIPLFIRNTDGNKNKTEVTNGWYELLTHPSAQVRGLGHDLVRYAIISSGFNYGPGTMFELIPVSFWVESGLSEAWRTIVRSRDMLTIDTEGVVVNFVRHNFNTLERFPEAYGYWTGKLFQSKSINVTKADRTHIKEFRYIQKNKIEEGSVPRFLRIYNDNIEAYRLYEGSPMNPLHFKEVEGLGEKYGYYETSVDGRHKSKHPKFKGMNLDPDPWAIQPPVTTKSEHALFGNSTASTNAYITQYLPEEHNTVEGVLNRLLADETDVNAKKNIQALLANVDKINSPIILEELDQKLGVFEIIETEDGLISTIKINPKAEIESEAQVRHIILHEINHAYSVGVLTNPVTEKEKSFARNVERLAKEVNMTAYEFIAELPSNKQFRASLKKGGLWSRFLRLLRKLLGFTDQYDDVLDQYYTVLDEAQDLQRYSEGEYNLDLEALGLTDTPGEPKKKEGKKRLTPLESALASLKIRRKLLEAKGKKIEAVKLKKDINTLKKLMYTKRNEAVIKYLTLVEGELKRLKEAYDLLAKSPAEINPDVLFAIREQLISYRILDAFSDQIRLNPEEFVPEGNDSKILLDSLDTLRADVHRLTNDARRLGIQRFAHIIHSTLEDPNVTIDSIVDQLEVADRDIDWLNRWAETGVEMNDVAIKTAHKLLSDNYAEAYRATQDDLYDNTIKKQDLSLVIRDPEGGWKRTELTFESTGIMKALEDYENYVGKSLPLADKFAPFIEETSLESNDDGVHLIHPTSPKGKRLLSIPKDSKEYPVRQFYETVILQYFKSQEKIPSKQLRPGLRIPSIQRSFIEGLSRESGVSKLTTLKEGAIDAVRKRYDESDFKAVDQNGNPQEYIPVRYIAKQDGQDGRLSTREVSLDLATTLPLFMNEMHTREGLEALHSDLELGKLVLGEREVMKTKRVKGKGLSPWLMRTKEGIRLASGKFDTKKGTESNSYAAYDTILRRLMYGQYKKDEGSLETEKGTKFSIAKIADSLLTYSGFKILFGNLAIPATNALVGELTLMKEVTGGNIINMSDYKYGKKFFSQIALPALQDSARRKKQSKAGRVMTYFNPVDNNRPVDDLGINTNWMRTGWNNLTRSGGNTIEYYLGSQAIGIAFNRFRATKVNGNSVPLYEAIEVSDSGKVTLAPGYTYKGKNTMSSEDINEVRNYALRSYQLMNGIYNKIDKPAMNELVVGRLVGFMRSWLMPGIQARWKTKDYDERLKQQFEGHYLSTLVAFNNGFTERGFVGGTINSLRVLLPLTKIDPEMLLLPDELDLSQDEKDSLINMRKANIRKTLFEVYLFVGLTLAMGLLWEDDDESYTKYLLARIRREISTFYSPATAWDVLRSPTVALNAIDGFRKVQGSLFNSIGAAITGDEQPIYIQGPYKDRNKLGADLERHFGLGFLSQFQDLDVKTRLIQRGGYK